MADQFSALELLLDPEDQLADPIKRKATAAALRRQNAYGTLGQLMGVQPTQQAGVAIQEGAQQSLRSVLAKQQAAKEAAARASERQQMQDRWEAEQKRQAERDAEQRRQFQQQEARLSRTSSEGNKKRYDVDPNSGRIFDTFTGVFVTGSEPGAGAPAPDGLPESGLRVTPPGGKPPSESEAKTGMRAGVGVSALQQITGLPQSALVPGRAETVANFFGLPAAQQSAIAGMFGGPERILARGAQDQFIDQALTEMTGAAYTEHQLNAFRSAYMPTRFDNDASRAEKLNRAYQYVRGQAQAAGRAWTPERDMQFRMLMQSLEGGQPQQDAQPTGQAQGVSQSGGKTAQDYLREAGGGQ